MLLVMTVLYILLSTFVGASSVKDDSKIGYFIVATILYVAVVLISFLLIYK